MEAYLYKLGNLFQARLTYGENAAIRNFTRESAKEAWKPLVISMAGHRGELCKELKAKFRKAKVQELFPQFVQFTLYELGETEPYSSRTAIVWLANTDLLSEVIGVYFQSMFKVVINNHEIPSEQTIQDSRFHIKDCGF